MGALSLDAWYGRLHLSLTTQVQDLRKFTNNKHNEQPTTSLIMKRTYLAHRCALLMEGLVYKTRSFTPLLALAGLALSCASANAAISITDTFESGSGNWTTSTASYIGTAPAGLVDLAEGSDVAVLDTTSNGTPLTLTMPLALDSLNATEVTISYNGEWGLKNSATRFYNPQFSINNGATWTNLGNRVNSNVSTGLYTDSRTVTGATNMTDEFLFRFLPKNDGGSNDYRFYMDEVTISHNGIPEPTTALLGGLGGLLLLRRRRG